MNICAIVCEFDPFHRGHRHLIDECRRVFGADSAVVCAMSGDFVQRGASAAFLKHDRARAAAAGGADLVLELPLPWCMSTAETFARGAVGLLGACGLPAHLCFGSESGDLSGLQKTAALLLDPETGVLIRRELESGIGYAAARQRAVEALTGAPSELLRQPNDILAVEYLKALETQGISMEPFAVLRRGARHGAPEEDGFPSSSFLREKLRKGEDVGAWMPPESAAALAQGTGALNGNAVETAILSRLRFLPEEAFAAAPDVSEGLDRRVLAAARTAPTLEALDDAASTKRYPRARVRRIALSAALGIRREDAEGLPPYLRVLAANAAGLALLREMETRAPLPILTKPAQIRRMGERAQRVFALGAAAADLCALGLSDPASRRGDRDWRSAPAILD